MVASSYRHLGWVGFSLKEHQKNTFLYRCLSKARQNQRPTAQSTARMKQRRTKLVDKARRGPSHQTNPHMITKIVENNKKMFFSEGSPLGASQWEAE